MKTQYTITDEFGSKTHYSDRAMMIRHREDGPAYEGCDGYRAWYFNGKRHREDGPAVVVDGVGGYNEWWINGEPCSDEAEFDKRRELSSQAALVE